MEFDDEVNENLKMQFKALQEQQQKRMQSLMERKKAKQHNQGKSNTEGQGEAFGVPDDLSLSTPNSAMPSEDIRKRLLENENEQLQNQLRETEDENGRLYKLLKERDFEIKQLQKKIEEERLALMGTSGLAGDVAATKIVELAKRNRHLTAEMEKEKTKVKQLKNRIKDLESELQISATKPQPHGDKDVPPARKTADTQLTPETKVVQGQLSAANLKISELRNQLQTTKQELKMTQKLLANEVGEDVSVQNLLATPGSWRGRAQQILVLQSKVRELESQLGHSRSRPSERNAHGEGLGLTDSGKPSAQEKNVLRIRTLEREKKEAVEKLTGEYSALQKDHEDVKKKLDGAKARNQVLSNEVKTLKEQISTLLDKGKHDDELIDALLSQLKDMQVILKNLSQQDERSKECRQSLGQQLNLEAQKQNSLIEQLKRMVAEREAQVQDLEKRIEQLTTQHRLPQTEDSSSDSISAESLEGEDCLSAPKKHGLGGRNGSGRTVSKMGHTLVDSAAPSVPFSVSPDRVAEPDDPDAKARSIQMTELKALCQAAEVERDRLIELVSVLQKRVDESTSKAWETEKMFQEEQRRCLALEKQIEKLKTELGKNTGLSKAHSKAKTAQLPGSARVSGNAGEKKDRRSPQLSEVPLESQVEELSARLEIQTEENEGLRSALRDLGAAKEEDFRVFQETVGRVKEIFLQALRQQKSEMT
uniref:Coiled-coil domain-containing protein 13 n=1 Tax=Pogona vitticeps TaxID=103695 RepID=A0ABM5GMM0_9SAUR